MGDFKLNVLDVAPRNFSEFLAQQESQNRLGGGDYTTMVINSVTELEDKGDIDITLKVTNKEGKAIGFSDKMIAGNDITYTAEIKAKPGKTVTADDLEKYKKNLKWLFWVGGEKPTESGARKIMSDTSNNDTTTSFMKNEVVTKNNIDKAYYYSRIATNEEGKAYKTKLTVKWSKWLELAQDKEGKKRIRVEAYINKPKKTSAGNNGAASRLIQANPEILEAYWLNAEGKRIIETGYTQDTYLHLKTLGLLDQDLEVNVYDKDYYPTPNQPTIFYGRTAKDDLITWENNTIRIEDNNALKQFKVGNKIRYEKATADEDNDYKNWYEDAVSKGDLLTVIDPTEKNNTDLELYIHFPNWKTIKLPADNEYAKLILTAKERIADAFFTEIEKEEVQADAPKNPKTKVSHYKKINKGVLGQKVKLVAACANLEGKKVVFRVFEKTPVLVGEGEPLHLIYKGAPVCLIEAEVKEGYAVAEIGFQKVDTTKYDDWDKILDPSTGDLETSKLFLKVSCIGDDIKIDDQCFLEDESKEFGLGAAMTTYEIYHDHKIYKTPRPNAKKAMYIYYDASGKEYKLHKAKYIEVTNKYGSFYGGKKINLIDIRNHKSFNEDNLKYELFMNPDTVRFWINEHTFASLLGALLEVGFEDITYNGFSKIDGSPGKSTSHKNGYNGDFRYLREDKTGGKIVLNYKDKKKDIVDWEGLDEDRQVKFNKALKDFGWGTILSQKYDDDSKKLEHTTEDKKHKNHYNHFHLQSYNKNLIIIKK